MNYRQSIEYFYELNLHGGKLGLSRVKELLFRLGNPHKKLKIVHVGGTSGKGSTTAMVASVLHAAGFRVGRFTKPHLSKFSERIDVDGISIPDQDLARIATKVKKESKKMSGEKPTFFEIVVACAFAYFAEKGVDFAVVEVGMGGRLDATNVCNPLVSIITNVSLEHKEILGSTIEKIAFEKAGIIKKNGSVITAASGKALAVISKICKERNASIYAVNNMITPHNLDLKGQNFSVSFLGKNPVNLFIPLIGEHQLKNAACAVGAIRLLQNQGIIIKEKDLLNGLKTVKWPGRFEIVQKSPFVVLDCAKDAHAMKMLEKSLHIFERMFKKRKLVLVLSVSSDKEYLKMLANIIPTAELIIASEHNVNERALPAEVILAVARKMHKKCEIIRDIRNAVCQAIKVAGPNGLVVVTGSVFAVGEARALWFKTLDERHLNEILKKDL